MSVEQRLDDALSDLRVALGDGVAVDEAVAEVAAAYGFKSEVLRIRAVNAFGSLESIGDEVRLERVVSARDAALRSIFVKLRAAWGLVTHIEPPPTFAESIEKDFGFVATEPKGSLSAEKERGDFYRQISSEIDQVARYS